MRARVHGHRRELERTRRKIAEVMTTDVAVMGQATPFKLPNAAPHGEA
jgi:hypothetical protein